MSEKIEAGSERKHGGLAFPGAYVAYPKDGPAEGVLIANGGMTLRDWFAGQIFASMIGSPGAQVSIKGDHVGSEQAATAYCLADAMLAERLR